VEISVSDAAELGIAEGDLVRVVSRRGELRVPARVGDIRAGTVFAPFHYGYFDAGRSDPDGRPTAANELTMTEWDPVSKQPLFKNAAVRIERLGATGGPAPAPTTTASRPAGAGVPATVGGPAAEASETVGAVPAAAVASGEERS
jgi:predicted molibdopterin-dependent oxidoreductase YjgC